MSVKGYPSQTKLERGKAEFATIEPVREGQNGLSVNAHMFTYSVGTDAAEASSTNHVINATAHVARKGDVIRFTSGTFADTEVKVSEVSTNTITLAEDMASAIATGVTFQILRPKYPVVAADGQISVSSGPVQFVLDGVATEVTEDTVTPANNVPLPVKLTSVTGDINITAGDLNVHLSASGANYDSTRIGDGTNLLGITAANEAKVSLTTELPAGTQNIGGVEVTNSVLPTGAATEATLATMAGDISAIATDVDLIAGTVSGTELQVDIVSSALPTGAATSALQATSEAILTTIDADTGGILTSVQLLDDTVGTDTVLAPTKGLVIGGHASGAGTQFNIVHVSNGGAMKVDNSAVTQPISAASLPLPTGAATETTLSALNTKVTAVNTGAVTISSALPAGTNNIGDVDVLSLPAIPSGTNTIGKVDVNTLDVVDFLDTPLLIASSTNIPASASTPLTVVASLAAAVKKIQALDTTGEFVGVYSDPAGTPVLQCIIGPGSDSTIELALPAATVIGLRNMKNAAISVGEFAINFIG